MFFSQLPYSKTLSILKNNQRYTLQEKIILANLKKVRPLHPVKTLVVKGTFFNPVSLKCNTLNYFAEQIAVTVVSK